MNKPTTIKELCEFIWYLEKKYDLLDFEIDNVKIWQYVRMKLYYKLAEASEVLAQPHTKLTKFDELKYLFSYIKHSLISNYYTLQKRDIVIFSHPRVVKVDDEYIDIYTKYFIDELESSNQAYVEFENAYLGKHYKQKKSTTHFTDWMALSHYIHKIFMKVSLTESQKKIVKEIEQEINTTCECRFNLIDFFSKNLKTYRAFYKVYFKVLQKVNPKILYIVVAYIQAPIIKAAKDNGIEVRELQHGTFSRYHLGYSFPDRQKPLDYFPDKLYVWNEFWSKMLQLPIAKEKILIDKFRYLEYQKSHYTHLQKKEKQLVVLSQGAIGNAIAEKILKHYDRFKDYEIKYKLHPGEFDRWENYSALNKLSSFSNVKIVKNEEPLYELFATSSLQIGVFSTALYEGVEFGCQTILLNINGIEYMDKFIELYQTEVLD